jgi:3',5'-cyclic-AMP phosphodiesterase
LTLESLSSILFSSIHRHIAMQNTSLNQHYLVQLSDPHITQANQLAYQRVDTCAYFSRAIAQITQLSHPVDALLMTGDLTFDGGLAEYQQLRSLLQPLEVPVYLMPGNHDDRQQLRAVFSDHAELFQTDDFIQYEVDLGPYRLLCLDTSVPGKGHGELCAQRLAWLSEKLSLQTDRPVVIAMHHPPFQTHIRSMDQMGLVAGRQELAQIMSAAPQIQRLLCGHLHRPIQTLFGGVLAQTAPSTAHQMHLSLGVDQKGQYNLEPPGYLLHVHTADQPMITHQVMIGRYDGPFAFRD